MHVNTIFDKLAWLAAAGLFAIGGPVLAAPETPSKSQGVITAQGPETPPDCEKNPDDPRCKNRK